MYSGMVMPIYSIVGVLMLLYKQQEKYMAIYVGMNHFGKLEI